jgi:hypothetical protein
VENQANIMQAIVYFVICPCCGPEHRVFHEDEIEAKGGVHAIELSLQRECYWYAYLGWVVVEVRKHGFAYPSSSFTQLPQLAEVTWKTGRRNPSFQKSEAERLLFKRASDAIARASAIPDTFQRLRRYCYCRVAYPQDWITPISQSAPVPPVNPTQRCCPVAPEAFEDSL